MSRERQSRATESRDWTRNYLSQIGDCIPGQGLTSKQTGSSREDTISAGRVVAADDAAGLRTTAAAEHGVGHYDSRGKDDISGY